MIGCKIYCSIDQYIIPLTGWKAFNDKNALYVIEHYKIVYYLHNLLTIIKRNECLWLLKGSHCWRLSSWNMNFDAEILAFFFTTECMQWGSLGKVCLFCVCIFLISTQVSVAYGETTAFIFKPNITTFLYSLLESFKKKL